MEKNFEIYSVEWERVSNLPEMSDCDMDHVLHYSRKMDGVEYVPFITIYSNNDGNSKRIYLGA